jgi:hypothetical protein
LVGRLTLLLFGNPAAVGRDAGTRVASSVDDEDVGGGGAGFAVGSGVGRLGGARVASVADVSGSPDGTVADTGDAGRGVGDNPEPSCVLSLLGLEASASATPPGPPHTGQVAGAASARR